MRLARRALLALLPLLSTAVAARRPPPTVPPLGKGDDLTGGIKTVSVNSGIVPRGVLVSAARASKLLDETPPAGAASEFADRINVWYRQNGYTFSRVTSRSAVQKGKLSLTVVEPRVAATPVSVQYYSPTEEEPELFPRIAYVSTKDIHAGDEVFIDYGDEFWQAEPSPGGSQLKELFPQFKIITCL